jgi:hypothetical protein
MVGMQKYKKIQSESFSNEGSPESRLHKKTQPARHPSKHILNLIYPSELPAKHQPDISEKKKPN